MNWMQTLNGTKWNLLAPRAADVDFREIAHSLSVLPRFLGHTTCPYSVAEHCCHAHDWLQASGYDDAVCLWGLLHDAHEAFTGDLTTPLKAALIGAATEAASGPGVGVRPGVDYAADAVRNAIKDVQARQDRVIFEAAGLSAMLRGLSPALTNAMAAQVKQADRECLIAERHALMGPSPEPWDAPYEGEPDPSIQPEGWRPADACGEWLERLWWHQQAREAAE